MDRAEAGLRAQSGEKPEGGYYTNSERITLQKFSLGRITTLPRSVFGGRTVAGGGGGGAAAGGGAGGGTGGGGGAIVVRPQTSLVDRAQTLQIQTNSESIGGLQQTLNSINEQLTQLTQGINGIAQQLQAESALEQNQLKQEQEAERRLAERQVRLGKESELERNIQAALARPIARLQQKVTSLFERIMGALTTLFFGWLTNQGIETLKALAEGDTEKLEEIKNNIIKNITYAVGAFAAVKIGFDLLLRTISRLSLRLLGLIGRIAASPFKLAADAVRRLLGLGGGKTPSPPGRGPSPPPGKGPKPGRGGLNTGIFGYLFSGINAFMNAKNGEYVDTAMNALSLFGPGKFVKGLMGIGFAADQIAEVFGMNIFGKDPNKQKQAASVVEEALKQKETSSTSSSTTMMDASKEKTDAKQITLQSTTGETSSAPAAVQPQNGETSSAPAAVQPQTSAIPSMSEMTFGVDNKNMLQGLAQPLAQETKLSIGTVNFEGLVQEKPPTAEVKAPPKPDTPVGTLPEPKPNIIMAGGGTDRTQTVASQQQPLTDVPFIPSSNTDNFYVLYSQLNYNVVM